MNPNDMLDYALGQLEGPALEQAERDLALDADLAARVGRLSDAVGRLCDDGRAYEPPPDLAQRACLLVAQARDRRRNILDFVPTQVPFRWSDVAVAAGVLLAGVLTLFPAVYRSREKMTQAGCISNLQKVGQALWLYGNSHRHYPFGPEQSSEAHAGSFAAMLHDEGFLDDVTVLDCPSNGPCHHRTPLPRFAELILIQRNDPDRLREALCWDYAYNISYRHRTGRVEPIENIRSPRVPLLADQPDHESFRLIRDGNSPNHGGRGQNVLYSDLHVGWHNTRRLSPADDDMFLNAEQQLAPGLNEEDFVLTPALVPFHGLPSK